MYMLKRKKLAVLFAIIGLNFVFGCSKQEDAGVALPSFSADFTCTPDQGVAPLSVTCTCNSTASSITNYEWTVNGVTSGSTSSLTQRFDKAGTVSILLKVKGKVGTTTKSVVEEKIGTPKQIIVNNPKASLVIDPPIVDGSDDLTKMLVAYKFSATYSNVKNTFWVWGDGTSEPAKAVKLEDINPFTQGRSEIVVDARKEYTRGTTDVTRTIYIRGQDLDGNDVRSNTITLTIKARQIPTVNFANLAIQILDDSPANSFVKVKLTGTISNAKAGPATISWGDAQELISITSGTFVLNKEHQIRS